MSIKSIRTRIAAAFAAVVAFVRSLIQRDPVERAKAKIEKLSATLDAVVDAEVERRRLLMERRNRLRREIDLIWDEHDASERMSLRAGALRRDIAAAIQ